VTLSNVACTLEADQLIEGLINCLAAPFAGPAGPLLHSMGCFSNIDKIGALRERFASIANDTPDWTTVEVFQR
jgi:hypothetical protein